MKSLTKFDGIFVANGFEFIDDEELHDRKGNAKLHPAEQLARLAGGIREFGFLVPLLIDDENRIIAGHGRRLAGRAVGMQVFPCVRVGHLTKAQVRALVLFDNKIAETGFDQSLLKVELTELADLDEELLGLTGFTADELDNIINALDRAPEKVGDGEKKKAPELRFGSQKVPLSESELQALESLADLYLRQNGDLIGFVEKALLKSYA